MEFHDDTFPSLRENPSIKNFVCRSDDDVDIGIDDVRVLRIELRALGAQ
jgi:hypothetical protein